MIYSAGPCAVCFDSGDALFVRAIDTGKIFFLCPSCGCAWAEPPTAGEVETIDPPEVFAPAGFTLATKADIHTARWVDRIAIEYPDTDVDRVIDFKGFRPAVGSVGFIRNPAIDGESHRRRRITRWASWDAYIQIAFIIVMLLSAGALAQLASC